MIEVGVVSVDCRQSGASDGVQEGTRPVLSGRLVVEAMTWSVGGQQTAPSTLLGRHDVT